jgi:deferrochelatase/peroxidase EfeB
MPGTMPGVKSLEINQYYANPGNQFWKLLASSLNQAIPLNNEEKLNLIKNNKLALWDVLLSCEREGSSDAKIVNPVPNNFDYRDDAAGLKCPFHSHIRKTNPRGESVRPGLASSLDEERQHIMVRRGITYGERKTKPAGKNGGIEFTDQPTGGVGLLFMAYQNDIATQFEFTQAIWANNKNFVNSGTGIDPVIGQGDAGGQKCPVHWGGSPDDSSKPFDFRGFVSMKGGEYFFAPSLSALKNL